MRLRNVSSTKWRVADVSSGELRKTRCKYLPWPLCILVNCLNTFLAKNIAGVRIL